MVTYMGSSTLFNATKQCASPWSINRVTNRSTVRSKRSNTMFNLPIKSNQNSTRGNILLGDDMAFDDVNIVTCIITRCCHVAMTNNSFGTSRKSNLADKWHPSWVATWIIDIMMTSSMDYPKTLSSKSYESVGTLTRSSNLFKF